MPPETLAYMTERRVGLVGALMILVGQISMVLYTPAMPQIVVAFGTTEAAVKMTLTIYFAGFAVSQLFCGPLSDGLGRKPTLVAFMGIYLVASIVALFAPSVEDLIAARFFQGVGASAGTVISRALIRDLFQNDAASRAMAFQTTFLALGPALSPTLGGLIMEFAGWQAIFAFMAGLGAVVVLAAQLSLRETVTRDLSQISLRAVRQAYASLLGSCHFMLCCLVLGGTVGTIFTGYTMLPFIVMNRIGLSPTQFGIGMLALPGGYFLGALTLRFLIRRFPASKLVVIGLVSLFTGCVGIGLLLRITSPTYLTVVLPMSFFSYSIPFVVTAMTTAALAPFPRIAGSAASLTGFIQLGAGVAGGAVGAAMGDPVHAISTVLPAMGSIAIVSWLVWSRLQPYPAQS